MRRRTIAALLVAALASALPAGADGPTLHSYFEPDPQEDLRLEAKVGGGMSAAIDTPSGIVEAPDTSQDPSWLEKAYGGSSTPDSLDASYRIDRDTSRPEVVSYDDPFVPSVTPFKRLHAYDTVNGDLELVVGDKDLEALDVGGAASYGDDQFYGEMNVDLQANVPVRVPSPGPGARVLAVHTKPSVQFELLRDGADNWFIRSPVRERVRLVMQLAVDRRVFGHPFSSVGWGRLRRQLKRLPPGVQAAAGRVLNHLGVSTALSPAGAVEKLVGHFRSFAPSDEHPSSSGAKLYEDLALLQKGVCRHRAYAFVITATALGLPARMVRNEAHAWVEVWDSNIWHRIDLGGAAGSMQMEYDDSKPTHQAPTDPYQWPEGSQSAEDMVSDARSSSQAPRSGSGSGTGPASSGSAAPGSTPPPRDTPPIGSPQLSPSASAATGPSADAVPEEEDDRAPLDLNVQVKAETVRRGSPLLVSGRAESEEGACGSLRVDVRLRAGGREYTIGTLATDDQGRYQGAVVIPPTVGVGEYDLFVVTKGNASCGAARAQ